MLGFSHCFFFTLNTVWALSSGPPWQLREALIEWRSTGFSLCEWDCICWPLNPCHVNSVCQHSSTFLQLSVQRSWEQMIVAETLLNSPSAGKDRFFSWRSNPPFHSYCPTGCSPACSMMKSERIRVLSSLRCFQGVTISCCRHQHPHLLNCLGRLNCTRILYDRRTNSKVKQRKVWVTHQHVGVTYLLRDHMEWCSKESN